jgi:glycosyltransferase involved in cell wall biosynthesis
MDVFSLPQKMLSRLGKWRTNLAYTFWIRRHDSRDTASDLRLKKLLNELREGEKPLISILMPVFNTNPGFLRQAIDSVRGQIYEHWELCIVDDGSTDPGVATILNEVASDDSRIRVQFRGERGGIAKATNTALEQAHGDFIAFLDHDDLLPSHSLAEIVLALADHPDVGLLYTDEDKITVGGRRFDPYFKPDWNPDLLLSQNYICHLCVVKTSLAREVGGIQEEYDGAQDWDFVLRVSGKLSPRQIQHIPRVLYHWRTTPTSTARSVTSKPHASDAGRRVLEAACRRNGIGMHSIDPIVLSRHWRIRRILPSPVPLVSVIVPVRNRPELLKQCLAGLREKTDYPNLEILIADNGSDDPSMEKIYAEEGEKLGIVRCPGPFNYSAINNRAVAGAKGEIVVLLNNDVLPLHAGWLTEMVSHAARPEIGAVGGLLLYPNGRIQHAGITLGIAGPMRVGGVAGHPGKRMRPETYVTGNLLQVVRNVSAVTGACLAVRRSVYLQVGGMDEDQLPIAFNDVDFCIRVMGAGYRNLWTPFARLTHHESASRGTENSPEKIARFKGEIGVMRRRWRLLLDNDPAYNPNLTLVHENWSFARPRNGAGEI